MPTIKDVARMAGVSLSTVSKYINGGTVREKNVRAIREAIDTLGFQVNPFARSLKTQRSNSIGILLPSLSAPFFGAVLAAVDQVLRREGYHSLIACYTGHALEQDYLKFLISTGVDGLIYVPEDLTAAEFAELTAGRNVPVVQVDRMIPGVVADAVLSDNVQAACRAVTHLLDRGHRRVAAVFGAKSALTAQERLVGYLRALDQYGVPHDDALVVEGTFDFTTGYRGLVELMELPSPPTAIFSSNYDITIGLITAARERGLRIPEDVDVFGYDSVKICSMMTPPLPVVQQPEEEIGRTAANRLLRRLSGSNEEPRLIRLTSRLVL